MSFQFEVPLRRVFDIVYGLHIWYSACYNNKHGFANHTGLHSCLGSRACIYGFRDRTVGTDSGMARIVAPWCTWQGLHAIPR